MRALRLLGKSLFFQGMTSKKDVFHKVIHIIHSFSTLIHKNVDKLVENLRKTAG